MYPQHLPSPSPSPSRQHPSFALAGAIGRHALRLLTLRHDGSQLRTLRPRSLYLLCAMAIAVRAVSVLLIASGPIQAGFVMLCFLMLLGFLWVINDTGMLVAAFAILVIVTEPLSTTFGLLSWGMAESIVDALLIVGMGALVLRTRDEWSAKP